MADLDDPAVYKRLDPANMLEQLHRFPQQCRSAWHKANGFKLPPDYTKIDKVVILGMGGSAIAGDLFRSLVSGIGKPIIFVHRDYDLPAYVDHNTLVIASSYSGNTEETLSAFSQALKVKCKKLAMTTGGKLETLAKEAMVPVFHIDIVAPPRAALGYCFMPLLAFLQKLNLIQDMTAEVEMMIQRLEALREELKETAPASSNRAKQLATTLRSKIAVIYGAGILAAVARRWKTQFNENSKAWAFYEVFPELNHNAVVGYQFPKELASRLYVLLLRCPSLHPRTLTRYQLTSELLKQNGIGYEVVDSQGKSQLDCMMGLVYFGDWVSYYLAILNGIDPTPVTPIDYLKERLSESSDKT